MQALLIKRYSMVQGIITGTTPNREGSPLAACAPPPPHRCPFPADACSLDLAANPTEGGWEHLPPLGRPTALVLLQSITALPPTLSRLLALRRLTLAYNPQIDGSTPGWRHLRRLPALEFVVAHIA